MRRALSFRVAYYGKTDIALTVLSRNYLFSKFIFLNDKFTSFYLVLNDWICKYMPYKRILFENFLFSQSVKILTRRLYKLRFFFFFSNSAFPALSTNKVQRFNVQIYRKLQKNFFSQGVCGLVCEKSS